MRDAVRRFVCWLRGCDHHVIHSHKVMFEGRLYTYEVTRCSRCGAVELSE